VHIFSFNLLKRGGGEFDLEPTQQMKGFA